jgi:hypothetical protein
MFYSFGFLNLDHLLLKKFLYMDTYQGSFFWLQNKEGLTLVGIFMEGHTLIC